MFTQEQILYMKSIGLHLDFALLSPDDFALIEATVAERLQKVGFDKDYNVSTEGALCEAILDALPNEQ